MRGDVQIATSNFGIDLGAATLWCQGRSNSNRLDRQYRPSQAEPAVRNDTSGMVCSLKTGHLSVKNRTFGKKCSPADCFGHNSLSRHGRYVPCSSSEYLIQTLRCLNTWVGDHVIFCQVFPISLFCIVSINHLST